MTTTHLSESVYVYLCMRVRVQWQKNPTPTLSSFQHHTVNVKMNQNIYMNISKYQFTDYIEEIHLTISSDVPAILDRLHILSE